MSNVTLVVKRAEHKIGYKYTIQYLDMMFTVTMSKNPQHRFIKSFAGWRQDDRSYKELLFRSQQTFYWFSGTTYDQKLKDYISDVCIYIKGLYGYDKVDYILVDEFTLLMDAWLEN